MKTKQLFSIIFSVIFILLAVAFVFTYQQGYKTGSTELKEDTFAMPGSNISIEVIYEELTLKEEELELKKINEELNKIKGSKEYIAVQVCKTETRWKPECLAEEMNNNFKRDIKDYE